MKLKKGEAVCPKCNGRKQIAETNKLGYIVRYLPCNKCYGEGKLDWVEMITGKKFDEPKPKIPKIKLILTKTVVDSKVRELNASWEWEINGLRKKTL